MTLISVAAIILAAGGSTRFGNPKQLAIFRGQSLVRRVVAAATEAQCEPVIVVAGEHLAEIKTELAASSAIVIENVHWREGLGSSVRAGIEQLQSEQVDAVVLLACDQPFVDAAAIRSLVQLATESGKPIVASSYSGTVGIPALFQRSQFAELLALKGNHGAKDLITSRLKEVATVEFSAGAIDIDTPADFARLNASA
jgi:molybdenum cofactor cytidylyltransferase